MAANSNKVGAHGEKGTSFEESFVRLQGVVGRLSAGSLSLQEALAAFEEGMALADSCSQMLDEAELRVKQVSDRAMKAGSASLVELDEGMRGAGGSLKGEPFLVEIETYESTTIQRSSPEEHENAQSKSEQAPKGKAPNARPYLQPVMDDLDPLFDDED